MLDALNTAGSGMAAGIQWLNATAENVANAQDEAAVPGAAFRPRSVSFTAGAGGVAAAVRSGASSVVVQDPTSPVADGSGYVQMPDIDIAQQMTNMLLAQRTVELNAAVTARAVSVYQAAVDLGREPESGTESEG